MLIDSLVALFERRAIKYDPVYPGDPGLADLFGGGQVARSGLPVNEKTALTHSAVWRAVNFRSMVMGDIPVSIYRRQPDGGKIRLTDHPLYSLLHDVANEELFISAFTRQQLAENHVLTWGNEYAWIQRDGRGRPIGLWPHPPNMVTVDVTTSGALRYIFHGLREADKTYLPDAVLHFKGLGPDCLIGWSRIRLARESIGQALAAQQFGGAYFGQGARMGVVITTAAGFRPEDAKAMKESIADQTSGPDNWHRPLVIPQADKVVPITVPPEDAQFLGTQEWGVTEAARWFDVPLVFMMLPNSEPRANAEQDTLNFVTTTIAPQCRNYEQELNQKLLLPDERGSLFIEHNVDALLRGDFKSRMEGYAIARTWGLITANDFKRKENENPIGEEGDVLLVPMNSMNAKALVGQTEPPGASTPVAEPEASRSGAVDWLAVYRPLFADAAKRLLAKEERSFDAAIAKHGAAAGNGEMRRVFYRGHADAVRHALFPVILSLAQGSEADASAISEDIAARYCADAQRAQWPAWRDGRAWEFLENECRKAISKFKETDNGKATIDSDSH